MLPLVLTGGDMGLAPAVVGSLFAINAGVSLAATLPVAKVADKLGPSNIIGRTARDGRGVRLPAVGVPPGYEFVAVAMAVQGLGSCVWASFGGRLRDEMATGRGLARVCGDLGLLTGSAGFGSAAPAPTGSAPRASARPSVSATLPSRRRVDGTLRGDPVAAKCAVKGSISTLARPPPCRRPCPRRPERSTPRRA